MKRGGSGGNWRLLGGSPICVYYLRGEDGRQGGLALSGYWAEYTDESARVFRHGTIEGSAQWRRAQGIMALGLVHRSAADGHRWTRSLLLHTPDAPIPEEEFIRRFEDSGHTQRLLYNELLPRGLMWAESLETCFLSRPGGRAVVPLLENASPITADGALDEPAWAPVVSRDHGEEGVLTCLAPNGACKMLLRYDAEALYVGLSVPKADAGGDVLLEVMTELRAPTYTAPSWRVRVADGRVVSHGHMENSQELPWDGGWQAGQSDSGEKRSWEICIPYDSVGARPGPGTRWRMTCRITNDTREKDQLGASGEPDSEDDSAVEHGPILVFGPYTFKEP